MVRDGRLGQALARSLGRLAQGYAVSVLIGVPLGITMGRWSFVRRSLRPLVVGLQALPSICWLPLALLWFGLTEMSIIFVVVMGSVLAIAIAVEDGIRGMDPMLLRVSSSYGIRGARFYGGVLLPAALPGIITGLKLGAGGTDSLPAWSEDGKFKILRDAVEAESGAADSAAQAASIGSQLAQAASPDQAIDIVAGGVAEKLGTILVVPAADIDMTRPVTAYGLDSLNAIELRNWITKELGANLQVLELLTSGSLPSLAALIMKKREAATIITAKAG